MIPFDDAIKRLTELRDSARTVNDFEAWMDAGHELVESCFGTTSTQAINFWKLISDYKSQKIYEQFGAAGTTKVTYIPKFIEKLNYLIKEIEERRRMAIDEQRTNEINKKVGEQQTREKDEKQKQQAKEEASSPTKEIRMDNKKELRPTKWHLFKDIQFLGFLFAILVAIAGGAYKIGYDNGNSKYDKEKSDLLEENKTLKADTASIQLHMKGVQDTLKIYTHLFGELSKFRH